MAMMISILILIVVTLFDIMMLALAIQSGRNVIKIGKRLGDISVFDYVFVVTGVSLVAIIGGGSIFCFAWAMLHRGA